jgi:hypothetical protein
VIKSKTPWQGRGFPFFLVFKKALPGIKYPQKNFSLLIGQKTPKDGVF